MLVSNKNYTQQSSDVDSFGPVSAGIYCFAIPAGANRGRMASVCFDSDLYREASCPLIKNDMHMARLSEPMYTRDDFCEPYQVHQCLRKRIFANPIHIHIGRFSLPFVIPAEAIRGSRLDLRRHLCLRWPSRLPHRTPRRPPQAGGDRWPFQPCGGAMRDYPACGGL